LKISSLVFYLIPFFLKKSKKIDRCDRTTVTNNEAIDLKSVILFEKGDTLITTYPPPKILRD